MNEAHVFSFQTAEMETVLSCSYREPRKTDGEPRLFNEEEEIQQGHLFLCTYLSIQSVLLLHTHL